MSEPEKKTFSFRPGGSVLGDAACIWLMSLLAVVLGWGLGMLTLFWRG